MENNLQEEIDKARKTVKTDAYPMSIGELVNMYEEGDLEIRPEFQRLFRWSEEQKSKFIESILLGIPLPSIFVAQREDGVWELVDGLQRVSTILECMGKLKKEDDVNTFYPPLKLIATKYLPSLQEKIWGNPDDDDPNIIGRNLQRIFKREKIDVKIIQRESESDTKYEIFQRLNTGGSQLSDQEVRNALLLMIKPQAQRWIEDLAKNEDFIDVLPLSQKQQSESYYNELVIRYLAMRYIDSNKIIINHSDVAPYLDQFITTIFDNNFDYSREKEIFKKTFHYLNQNLGEKAFKKFNNKKNDYTGGISMPIFEMISSGVALAFERGINAKMSIEKINEAKRSRAEELSEDPRIERNTRPLDRMKAMAVRGKDLFY